MMNATLKRKLAVGTTLLAGAAFAGGAYAASTSTTNPRQAFLDDVAKRLHVTPQQLTDALQGAFADRLQQAVAAGKLTQAQADAIKTRMQQGGGVVPFGFGGGPGPIGPGPKLFFKGGRAFKGGPAFGGGPAFAGPGGRFSAVAGYLGITQTQLFKQLQAGKSLAQIAKAQGKSVDGLKAAMIAALKTKLDKAVAAKMLTSAQEQKLLKAISAHLSDEINGTGFGPPPGGFGMRGYFRHAAPPQRLFPAMPVPPPAPPVAGPVY